MQKLQNANESAIDIRENLSVDNSSLIFSNSYESSSNSFNLAKITIQNLLDNCVEIQHMQVQGYFVPLQNMAQIKQMKLHFSKIPPPPAQESKILNFDQSLSINKSDGSFQRLHSEQIEQKQLIDLQNKKTQDNSFEKQEKRMGECQLEQSEKNEIQCNQCPSLIQQNEILKEKNQELIQMHQKEKKLKEYYQKKVQKAGEIARH